MNFKDYAYIPTIRTRGSELLGVKELRATTKPKILPNVLLSRSGQNKSIYSSLDKWQSVFEGPAIIGLSHNDRLKVDEHAKLTSSDNNFENWFKFIKEVKKNNELLVPSIIFDSKVDKREFVKQIQKMEAEFGQFSLSVNPLNNRESQFVTTAAAIIDDVDNALFILDSGQITREKQRKALDSTIHVLNELRSIDSDIEIVTTSSSFPKNFVPYCSDQEGSTGVIPMLEWDIYHALGGSDVSIYGDYAAVHGEFYEGSYAKFVARVDYPTPSEWIFERRKTDDVRSREELYSAAAHEILTSESWDDGLDAWGADIIRQAALGDLKKFGTPSKWISVRVNLHIERILRFLESGVTSVSRDEDDENWDEW